MINLFACPVCQAPLHQFEKKWSCEYNHSFDIARKGYTNLLLAHQKDSIEPGDSPQMVASRRNFLNSGHYAPLAAKVSSLVGTFGSEIVLDSGCGEGYFINHLSAHLTPTTLVGIDISRAAVSAAASLNRSIYFAVASSFRLPILSSSLDCVMRIMAPGDDKEMWRVLRDGGYYVVVTPGPEHLFGLKQLIYAKTNKNTLKHVDPPGFEVVGKHKVSFILHLVGEDIMRLLAMTPYYWSIDNATRERVARSDELFTTVDFDISVARKTLHT